ncbi:MAG: PAS domain S-box protein [Gallionella sp.]|jgi:PAS domain S-box-containing protein
MNTNRTANSAAQATTKLASLASLPAVVMGAVVLIGWAFDIAALKSILPGWVSMKANTAVCFILIGISLFLTTRSRLSILHSSLRSSPLLTSLPSVLVLRLARFCGMLAGLIAALSLSEYLFNWNPGIDQWLFSEPIGTVGTSNPGRMAPETALCFLLLAAALWIIGASRKRIWTLLVPLNLGLLVLILALAAVQSYFTPSLGSYGWFGLTIMAMHTAILFAMLGAAVMAISWRQDVLSWSLSRRITAAFACGMALLAFIGLNVSRAQFWLKETNSQVEFSEKTLADFRGILIEVFDAQIHTRGYVITGDEQFKNNALKSLANSRVKLEALHRLMLVHPYQQQEFVRIDAVTNASLEWGLQVIYARRSGLSDAARNRIVVQGEALLSNLRSAFNQIEDEHLQHIQALKRESESVSQLVFLIIFAGTLFSLLIILFVIFRLNFAVSEREHKEQALRDSEERFRKITGSAQDAIIMMGADQRISFWNAAAERLFGYSAAEAMGQELHALIVPALAYEQFSLAFPQFLASGEGALIGKVSEVIALRKSGEEFPVALSISAVQLNGQWHAISIVRDISERKLAEAGMLRMNRLYKLLSRSNQAIVRSANKDEMFQSICRDAVQLGGMKMVWIGLLDVANKRIIPAGAYGTGAECLDGLQTVVDAGSAFGQESSARVICENRPFWCQDFMHDPLTARHHALGAQFGWAAKATLPLHRNGITIGCFTLYSGTVNAFDRTVRRLLVEIATDISYALNHFVIEAERKAAELQLLENEMQYRTLADSGQALIWASDADKQCNYFNQPWLKFTGRTLEQEAGNGWLDGVHPDDVAPSLSRYSDAFDRRESFSMTYRLRRHDGEYRWIQDDGCPRYNAGGEFVGYIGYGLDVTGRKRAEEALQNEALRRRLLMEGSQDGIAIINQHYQVVEANSRFTEMLGYTPEEMLSLHAWDFDATMTEADIRSRFTDIINTRLIVETRHRRKNGTAYDAEVSIGGAMVGFEPMIFTIARDITERKLKDAELVENERVKSELLEKLNEAQHLAQIGSWEWDLRSNYVWWSDETYLIFCVTPEDYLPGFEANRKFVHPDDVATYNKSYEHSLQTGEPLDFDVRLVVNDGQLKDCNIKGKIIYDASGQAVRFLGTIKDITERRRAELDQLAQLNELRRWNEATLGREMRTIELKHEVNELLGKLGQPPRYPSAEAA